ncbi:unnamed protein product, partial [Candidula unifasciata]
INALEEAVRRLQTLLTTNECLSNPCLNGGTCVDVYNGYLCRCPPNWQGPRCTEDVNECYDYAGTDMGCQNGATCINSPGSFRCQCTTNWYGIHCSEQHNDCTGASHMELCGHGTCVNEDRIVAGQPRYRCICETGWTKSSSGPACIVDVNECCFNIPGSFVCGHCPHGNHPCCVCFTASPVVPVSTNVYVASSIARSSLCWNPQGARNKGRLEKHEDKK